MNRLHDLRRDLRETARENWETENIAEALKQAKRAESNTAESELPRCPECNSKNITPKACRHESHSQRQAGKWRCRGCNNHFNRPKYDDE